MVDWVQRTARFSAACQLVCGLISLLGFTRAQPYGMLFVMLLLDTVVQAVEFTFYVILIRKGRLRTYYRYIDWFVTTPTMLVSVMMYLAFLADKTVTVESFASTRAGPIVSVIFLDVLMLVCGLLAELQRIPCVSAVAWGFVPFVGMHGIMYTALPLTPLGVAILTFQFVVWGVYGVAALFEYDTKNIMYNLLDLVSKNFYGLIVTITTFAE